MRDRTEIEIREHYFEDDGRIPNNADLPLLIYPQVLDKAEREPKACKELLARNGWGGAWVNGVFSYHHYHSNAHEVLVVVDGWAALIFGGPQGVETNVSAGDVVVIPAGVGHCKQSSGGGFEVIGAYPGGQENYDLKTGEPDERPQALENIRKTPLPRADPLFGEKGFLPARWMG